MEQPTSTTDSNKPVARLTANRDKDAEMTSVMLPMTALTDKKGFIKVWFESSCLEFCQSNNRILQAIRTARRMARGVRVGEACRRCRHARVKVSNFLFFGKFHWKFKL